MRLELTPSVILAAARDEANRHMRKHHRTKWNRTDYRVACRTADRLFKSLERPA